MLSQISAVSAIAAIFILPALAQSQPSTAAAPAEKPVASGKANPKFLQHPDGSMGQIQWDYTTANPDIPRVYFNSGRSVNGNAGPDSMTFSGDGGTVQDGKGSFYLEIAHQNYRITISGDRFDMYEIPFAQVPTKLLHLDGSPAEEGPPPAPSTVTGSLRVLPMAAAQVQAMEQGAHAPDWQLAEKVARLTLPQGAAMTVHQDKGDAPNFWRREDDEFSAFLFDEATNAVTRLSRTKSDPANSWKIVDAQGQVKGTYPVK